MKKPLILKIFLITCISFYAFAPLQAQQRKVQVITLQNGKTYKGKILPQPDKDKVKLQTPQLEILWLEKADVVKMEDGILETESQDSILPVFRPGKLSFSIETVAGLHVFGDNLYQDRASPPALGGRFSAGWNLLGYLRLGAGAGLDAIGNNILLPLFLDIRVRSNKAKFSPMADLALGHAFAWSYNTDSSGQKNLYPDRSGGFYAFPSLGASVCVGPRLYLHLLLGLRYQHVQFTRLRAAPLPILMRTETGFLSLKLGATF